MLCIHIVHLVHMWLFTCFAAALTCTLLLSDSRYALGSPPLLLPHSTLLKEGDKAYRAYRGVAHEARSRAPKAPRPRSGQGMRVIQFFFFFCGAMNSPRVQFDPGSRLLALRAP